MGNNTKEKIDQDYITYNWILNVILQYLGNGIKYQLGVHPFDSQFEYIDECSEVILAVFSTVNDHVIQKFFGKS